MTTIRDVEVYLKDLMLKMKIFGVLFLDDRGKNLQALSELDITPAIRRDIINSLTVEDYSQGPLDEKMRGVLPMWVFGKLVNRKEVYIKISLGNENSGVVCISFHIAEYPMAYPYKDETL